MDVKEIEQNKEICINIKKRINDIRNTEQVDTENQFPWYCGVFWYYLVRWSRLNIDDIQNVYT